jgi:hypothetical protein
MKKSILKTITAIMLLSFALSAVILNSCKKNVGDVYDYAPTVLAPDFEISSVDYAFDDPALDADDVSFKVVCKNLEVTDVNYSTVLNFYVDGTIQNSIPLNNIKSNTKYENVIEWEGVPGKHDFKFEINLTSDGKKVIDETNVSNNSQTTSLELSVTELVEEKNEEVQANVVTNAIAADPAANVADVMKNEGINLSTEVAAVKTTYSNNTTAIVAAVAKSDGTLDETKMVLSVTNNPGVTDGQQQEATSTVIVETLVDQKEVSFYNANEKLTYKDGVVSYEGLKSANAGCTEPSNMESFFANQAAKNAFMDAVLAAIKQLGVADGLASAPEILISILDAFNLTQGNIDNPPTFTFEITNSSAVCSNECVDGYVVNTFSYPGFILHFTDDRGTIPTFTKEPSCSASNNGTYTFEDCGGNKVSYTFNAPRPVITTTDQCVANVHN